MLTTWHPLSATVGTPISPTIGGRSVGIVRSRTKAMVLISLWCRGYTEQVRKQAQIPLAGFTVNDTTFYRDLINNIETATC
jgi:hypothetical protein